MGMERRDHIRFDSETRITIHSVDFTTNVKSTAFLMDCSRTGAKIVSPIQFDPDAGIILEIDKLGGPLEVKGKVVGCKEDPKQIYRFERTFVIHVKFDSLSDREWDDLLNIAKQI